MKPKVVKAPDPLDLDNMPKDIGIDLYYQADGWRSRTATRRRRSSSTNAGWKRSRNHVPTLISLARLYDRQDEFDKAEKLYRRAIEAEPDNAMAHNDLGLCLARHRPRHEAVAACGRPSNSSPPQAVPQQSGHGARRDRADRRRLRGAQRRTPRPPPITTSVICSTTPGRQGTGARREFTLASRPTVALAAQEMLASAAGRETTGGPTGPGRPSPAETHQGAVPDRGPGARRPRGRQPPPATPVAMVGPRPELRCIPAADADAEATLRPRRAADAPCRGAGRRCRVARQVRPWRCRSGSEFPVRTMSAQGDDWNRWTCQLPIC